MALWRPLLFLLAFFVSAADARVEYVNLQVQGTGTTLADAVNRALVEAIGQIHGKAIESSSLLVNMESSLSNANDEAYLSSETYLNAVKERTQGVISGYRILSKKRGDDGRWTVQVGASVAKYARPKSAGRKRIAVIPLRTARNTYLILGQRLVANDVGRRLTDSVMGHLVQTRRFTVLDREYTEDAAAERALAASNQVSVDEQVRLGQRLVADYVLTGIVENVEYAQRNKRMRMSGRTVTSGDGFVEIGYRLIDVALQQVAFSDHVRLRVTDRDLKALSAGASAERTAAALFDIVASKMVATITAQIYPMAVIAVDGPQVVIGQGGNGVQEGARYKVFKRGEKLYDPYTKEYLGRQERYCCVVQITRVSPKSSYGRIVEAELDIRADFSPGIYVLRGQAIKPPRPQARAQVETLRKKLKERKNASDDDW